MRVLASCLFHLLNWLRGPVFLLLFLLRAFLFLGLAAVLISFVAVPAQHETTIRLFAVGAVASFAAYLIRYGYDAALRRLQVAMFAWRWRRT